jgi:hypothetical protein
MTASKLARCEHRVLDETFKEEAVNESALNPGGRSPNALVKRHFGQCHHSTLQSLTPAISLSRFVPAFYLLRSPPLSGMAGVAFYPYPLLTVRMNEIQFFGLPGPIWRMFSLRAPANSRYAFAYRTVA